MALSRVRESLDGSESNFSLVDHAYANESALSEVGYGDLEPGASSNAPRTSHALRAYYPISTIMSNPRAASAAQTISTNLSNLNPLRPTTGPKTGATRGRAATAIVLSELPKISAKSFETYISSVKDEYTTWSKLQTALSDAPLLDELEEDDTVLDEESSKRRKAIKRALETSNISSKFSRKNELPPLEAIPPIFFEENFNLANPRTFDVVTAGQGRSSNAAEQGSEQNVLATDVSTDQILQEKLTYWLEVVELHLNVEISLRSASFFSALSNLKELDSQSAEAVKQIGDIKKTLDEVDAQVAKQGLDAVRQGIRRRRLNDLDAAVDRIKEVLRALDQAEELGEAGETEGALDLADEIEREWEVDPSIVSIQAPPTSTVDVPQKTAMTIISEESEEPDATQGKDLRVPSTPLTALRARSDHSRLVRIAQIKCLASLPTRLHQLRSTVAHSLEHELLAVLVHAAREGREVLIASAADWRSAPGIQTPAFEGLRESTSNRINTAVRGLVRCGKSALDDTILGWKAVLLQEARKTLKEMLPPSALHDEDETTADNSPSSRSSVDGVRTPLGDPLPSAFGIQSLDQAAYTDLMRRLYTAMLAHLILSDIHSRAIHASVAHVLESKENRAAASIRRDASSSAVALDNAWISALQSDLSDAVQAAAELINVRLARIVASRGEIHSRLSPFEFYNTFSESWQFVLDCEVLSRKMIVGLRGVIVGQAKAFLQQFHQQTVTDLAEAVEREQWSPTDVPASVQAVVDRILQSAVETPAPWNFKLDSENDISHGKPAAKQLAIEDRSYFAVPATLRCIEALEDYLKIAVNLPSLNTDVMSRIIELLKQYNSRVCQMVLGAGAMRSAGLKNITAKHLAMASQTISILISIIPYARECLRRHLRAKQAVILVDFDKLKRDCQEHQNEIHAKLVAIMGDRLAVHCKTLQEIDWERTGPSADKPNAYMETLVKETGTLHKVLLKYLAGSALEIVMMQVLSAINSRLAEEFGKIPLRSDEAKHRMLTDASYLRDKFQDLKGLERSPPGAELVHLVQDKMVERPAEPAVTKTRHFSTPSMTAASQRARMSHTRSSSTASLSKADDSTAPAQAQVDSVPEDTEALLPLNNVPLPAVPPPDASLTDVGASVSRASEASTGPLIQTQAEETPLPMSPEGEAPRLPIDDLVKETKSAQVQIPSASLALNSISGTPLPGKAEGQPHGAPPVNVKNRLAGLFAKRPSIPTIDVPSISINNALAKVKLPISGHEALASSISARTSGDGPSSGASTEQNTSRTILPQPAQGDREIAVVDDASPDARMQRLSEDDAAKPGEVDSTNVGDYEASDLPVQVSEDQSQRSDVAVSADVTVGPSEDLDTPATSTSIETESQQMEKPGVLDSEAARSANPGREDTIAGEIVTPSTESRELIQTLLPDAAADTKKAVQAQKDDAVSENDEGDTSGSTVSTFESEARSEGIAENYEARDDLDDID